MLIAKEQMVSMADKSRIIGLRELGVANQESKRGRKAIRTKVLSTILSLTVGHHDASNPLFTVLG